MARISGVDLPREKRVEIGLLTSTESVEQVQTVSLLRLALILTPVLRI